MQMIRPLSVLRRSLPLRGSQRGRQATDFSRPWYLYAYSEVMWQGPASFLKKVPRKVRPGLPRHKWVLTFEARGGGGLLRTGGGYCHACACSSL